MSDVYESLARLAELSDSTLARLEQIIENEGSDRAFEHALELRRDHVLPVDQPLALICQAQRSGGTLLGRLFDGHPQCHAHPHELHIGERRPHTWPKLSLEEEPREWFAKMREEKVEMLYRKGRRRIPLKVASESEDEDGAKYPMILPPALQRQIFLDEIERRQPISRERQILDAYMTSLFNAWLDNQNLRGTEKRWVVAFSPRRAWGEGLDKFFELYPDGRLISIIRDPLSWYTSAQGRDSHAEAETLIGVWKRSAEEMLEAARRFGPQVHIVRFEAMVLDTPATMRELAAFLEIEFDEVLTTPTLNGYAIGANSSFAVNETGVISDPVERYREILSAEQQALITEECGPLYDEVLALIGS